MGEKIFQVSAMHLFLFASNSAECIWVLQVCPFLYYVPFLNYA